MGPGNGQMPEGFDPNSTTPPTKPDGNNSSTPPEMPQGDNNGSTPSAPQTESNTTNN